MVPSVSFDQRLNDEWYNRIVNQQRLSLTKNLSLDWDGGRTTTGPSPYRDYTAGSLQSANIEVREIRKSYVLCPDCHLRNEVKEGEPVPRCCPRCGYFYTKKIVPQKNSYKKLYLRKRH